MKKFIGFFLIAIIIQVTGFAQIQKDFSAVDEKVKSFGPLAELNVA